MTEWLKAHAADGGVLLAILGAFAWIIRWLLRREVERAEARAADHEERLRKLEESRVTRADFDEMRMSIMATVVNAHTLITQRIDDLRGSLAQLTDHLLGRKP